MSSPEGERAIVEAQRVGLALLKVISPNDVGLTGGHQCGFYLPREAWNVFTTQSPQRGVNHDHIVEAHWPDGRITESAIKWYGCGSRFEYRMTRFGRSFPYLEFDRVGSVLVLIPERIDRFLMFVLDDEDDIEGIQAALGIELVRTWALYRADEPPVPVPDDDCIQRHFQVFTEAAESFPPTSAFAEEARKALLACNPDFASCNADERLMQCVEAEYALFQMVERKICEPDVLREFRSVDEFLLTAQSVLQRRKARAGRSLEHHVARLLHDGAIPFSPGAEVDGTRPDILIPGRAEYADRHFPSHKLFALGLKTTCKDRWRQVLREAPRVTRKHILTLQKGISPSQLDEMAAAGVTLVVPLNIQGAYPAQYRDRLMSVEAFAQHVRAILGGH